MSPVPQVTIIASGPAAASASAPDAALTTALSPAAAWAVAESVPTLPGDYPGQDYPAGGVVPAIEIAVSPSPASATAMSPSPDVFAGQVVAADPALAAANGPGAATEVAVQAAPGQANASAPEPTAGSPQIPTLSYGGSAGGSAGGGGLGTLFDEFASQSCTLRVRPAKSLACATGHGLLMIDGFSLGHDEAEDEELVMLALAHFGMLSDA